MRGKISARVPRKARDWDDIVQTLFLSDEDEATIMQMTPKERREAQEDGRRVREAPGYRSWNAESMAAYQEWEKPWRWGPGAPAMSWHEYLASINRLDLFRDITAAENGFHCGRCHQACDVPYCIPNEPLWLCKACTAGRPAQPGHWRQRQQS